MKKYIFTESQIKKIIDNQLTEQYGDTDTPEDMHYVQLALNKYLQSKNIRGVWDGTYDFKLNPKILINGTSGSIGSAALQLAKYFGAKHITAVCNTKNIDFLKSIFFNLTRGLHLIE